MTWIETERGFITPCHIWSGPRSGAYGWVSEHRTFAHRAAWEAVNGPIPEKMHIHHLCGSKKCVNAAHMELHTASEHRRIHGDVARRLSILSEEDVEDIRTAGETLETIAHFYGISKSYASKVRRGLEPEQFRLEQPLPAWAHGRPSPPRQKGNLSEEDIDLIRNNREFSLTELTEMFGMSRTYLNEVRQGRAPKP